MEHRAGEDFAKLMQRQVLAPLKMRDSSFAAPATHKPRALGHDKDGRPIEGGWRNYPELAAAGLWSTPTDVAAFVTAVMQADRGSRGAMLMQATAKEMLKAQTPS